MTEQQDSVMDLTRAWGQTASEGFRASADYFDALPNDAWHDPTGCAEWDERYLAGHILGEAVWFPNLLRGATRGEAPYPRELYDEMPDWPAERQVARLREAADELREAIDEAVPAYTEAPVDVGWTQLPIWRATYVSLMEGVYHNWDTRAAREPGSTIRPDWAAELMRGIDFVAPMIAHRKEVATAPGRYVLITDDGAGALTVVAQHGRLTVTSGVEGIADFTVHLTADQCVRLIAGRYHLAGPIDRGEVRVEGNPQLAVALNRIFGGIANG